jgi:membrane protein implicated in regulation of membrane protease activity
MDPIAWMFLIGGVVLLISEFVAPSLAAGFLGVGAMITAGLRALGVVDSVPVSLLLWAVSSVGLMLPLRPALKRLAGRADVVKDSTDVDQDRDAMGEVVDVVEDISEDHDNGRIRFQGTTWQARSTNGSILKGQKANLVYRQGSLWVVEPVPEELGARNLFGGDEAVEAGVEVGAEAHAKK